MILSLGSQLTCYFRSGEHQLSGPRRRCNFGTGRKQAPWRGHQVRSAESRCRRRAAIRVLAAFRSTLFGKMEVGISDRAAVLIEIRIILGPVRFLRGRLGIGTMNLSCTSRPAMSLRVVDSRASGLGLRESWRQIFNVYTSPRRGRVDSHTDSSSETWARRGMAGGMRTHKRVDLNLCKQDELRRRASEFNLIGHRSLRSLGADRRTSNELSQPGRRDRNPSLTHALRGRLD